MMQTDVKLSKASNGNAPFVDINNQPISRCRVRGIYIINGAAAGFFTLFNGQGGQPTASIATAPNTVSGYTFIPVPGEGLLFENSVYGAISGVTSVQLFYS